MISSWITRSQEEVFLLRLFDRLLTCESLDLVRLSLSFLSCECFLDFFDFLASVEEKSLLLKLESEKSEYFAATMAPDDLRCDVRFLGDRISPSESEAPPPAGDWSADGGGLMLLARRRLRSDFLSFFLSFFFELQNPK